VSWVSTTPEMRVMMKRMTADFPPRRGKERSHSDWDITKSGGEK